MNADGSTASRALVIRKRPELDEYWFREGCFVTELSNSSNDEDLSVARIRVPPGGQTRWHRLIGTVERYVILSGQGEVEVGDQPATRVSSHDVIIIPADCPQRIRNSSDQDLEFLALCTPRFRPDHYVDLDEDNSSSY
jgi:mannose-6-phosphate isomerase-like protein (cupin superfamily)